MNKTSEESLEYFCFKSVLIVLFTISQFSSNILLQMFASQSNPCVCHYKFVGNVKEAPFLSFEVLCICYSASCF